MADHTRHLLPELYRATAQFLCVDDPQGLLRHIVMAARELGGAEGVSLLLYDRARDLFVPTVPSVALGLDERWLQRQGLHAAQALAGRAMAALDLVEVRDTAQTPELEFPLLAGARRPGAVAAVPLIALEQVQGVLSLYFLGPHHAPLDGDLLRAFAELAGAALARTFEREGDRLALTRLQALDEAGKAVVAELALDRVLQRIVEVAARVVQARYGALGVADPDGYLTEFVTTGLSPHERELLGPLPRGHGLLGVLIREGRPLRVPAIGHDPRRVGFPPNHPPMTSLLGVPIRARGRVVGDLYLADKIGAPEFSEDDQQTIERLAAHAGIAIENARLYDQLRELTLLRERERIGRELHDGIIQDLYGTSLRLENLAEDAAGEALQAQLLELAEAVSNVIIDVRTYIQGLQARELEGQSLHEGITALAREINARGDLTVSATVEGTPGHLPEAVAHTLLQIAREALSNVARHAQAEQAAVHLRYDEQAVSLSVRDDGCGFAAEAEWGDGHRGLRNLRARVAEVGGSIGVQSRPGAGTTVLVSVPRP
jgi:signal transduction histidine kinase